jgi:hypothetical protein
MEFGHTYCHDLLTKILNKFILLFLRFNLFYTHFRSSQHFMEIRKPQKKSEKRKQYRAGNSAHGFGLAGKAGRAAHVVTTHYRRTVARPVRLTGGLPGDEIFILTTG